MQEFLQRILYGGNHQADAHKIMVTILAIAREAGIKPERLASYFTEEPAQQDLAIYVTAFNSALRNERPDKETEITG